MATPSITTVKIGDTEFLALSANVAFSTGHDQNGLPIMGSLSSAIGVVVDMHDDHNMPFASVKTLFDLANVVTKDKIKEIKIEFWKDENRHDVLCAYVFQGWISHWSTGSGGRGANHTLSLTIQPAMDKANFKEIRISN